MSIPMFFPPPVFVAQLCLDRPTTLEALCLVAGAACKASGRWVDREVEVIAGASCLRLVAEPGYNGRVQIEVPDADPRKAARVALGAMAYAMMDPVARESIRGIAWAEPAAPRGRPATGRAKSSKQRQREFRASRSLTGPVLRQAA